MLEGAVRRFAIPGRRRVDHSKQLAILKDFNRLAGLPHLLQQAKANGLELGDVDLFHAPWWSHIVTIVNSSGEVCDEEAAVTVPSLWISEAWQLNIAQPVWRQE